jgi:hypothetical protein
MYVSGHYNMFSSGSQITRYTTGCAGFAAPDKVHSAKISSAKISLPSAKYRALGKVFAECHVRTRQKIGGRQ